MSTPESLLEDVRYLLKKVTFLEGQDLKALCRALDLPVTNVSVGEMIEKIYEKMYAAVDSYSKMPDRETEKALQAFRYNILIKSKFLEKYLEKIKKTKPD